MNQARLRPLDILFITLTTLAMFVALARNANACPQGPKDDRLTFQRLMINFGKFTMPADALARVSVADWLKNKDQISKAIESLNVVISCADIGTTEVDLLLPSAVSQMKPETRTRYVAEYLNWMSRYRAAVVDYQTELKRLLAATTKPGAFIHDIDTTQFLAFKNTLDNMFGEIHSQLRTSDWCDSKLQ